MRGTFAAAKVGAGGALAETEADDAVIDTAEEATVEAAEEAIVDGGAVEATGAEDNTAATTGATVGATGEG